MPEINNEFTLCPQHDGTLYKRYGCCCKCGECCLPTCPINALILQPDGTHICSKRTDHFYLSGCNIWPTMPEHIQNLPKCTYKFELINGPCTT